MKVRERSFVAVRRGIARMVTATSIAMLMVSALPSGAYALSRGEVIDRANSWVAQGVGYSRRAYFQGYRQDCSGFVSMAWGLGTSLSTKTIMRVATAIPTSELQPGDAILERGHVQLFAGWVDPSKGTYLAIEEIGRGRRTTSHVKRLPRRFTAIRHVGII